MAFSGNRESVIEKLAEQSKAKELTASQPIIVNNASRPYARSAIAYTPIRSTAQSNTIYTQPNFYSIFVKMNQSSLRQSISILNSQ